MDSGGNYGGSYPNSSYGGGYDRAQSSYGQSSGNQGYSSSYQNTDQPKSGYGGEGGSRFDGGSRGDFRGNRSMESGRGRGGSYGNRPSYNSRSSEPSKESQFVDSPDTVYFSNVPSDTTEDQIAEHFGSIGRIKLDKKLNKLKVTLYRDKVSGTVKGDGTVTYEDPDASQAAVDWFNGKEFRSNIIKVERAQRKDPALFNNRGGGGMGRGGRPNNRGPPSRPGDWSCDCGNVNFAHRDQCHRCHAPKTHNQPSDNQSESLSHSREKDSHRDRDRDRDRDRRDDRDRDRDRDYDDRRRDSGRDRIQDDRRDRRDRPY